MVLVYGRYAQNLVGEVLVRDHEFGEEQRDGQRGVLPRITSGVIGKDASIRRGRCPLQRPSHHLEDVGPVSYRTTRWCERRVDVRHRVGDSRRSNVPRRRTRSTESLHDGDFQLRGNLPVTRLELFR